MKFEVTIKGLNEAIKAEEKNSKSIKNVDKILNKYSQKIKAEAKQNATKNPKVRTGFLRRTIGAEKASKYKYVVYSGANYGLYQEEGTKNGIKAKYFIKKAVINNVDKIQRDIKNLIK